MTTPATGPYPEHNKQQAVLEKSQALGEFLDEGPYVLAEYRKIEGLTDPQLMPVTRPIQQVLANWFGIDLDRIEAEKREMLAAMRDQ